MAAFDGLRRAFGITTEGERVAGDARMKALGTRSDPAARFAVAVAQDLSGEAPSAVRRALPGIERPSSDQRVRTAQIADAVLQDAERFMNHGDDRHLGRELGHAVRASTLSGLVRDPGARRQLVEAASSPGRPGTQQGFVADVVAKRHEHTTDKVDRYLEASIRNEQATSASAIALTLEDGRRDREQTFRAAGLAMPTRDRHREGEMREAASLALARARAGMLPPAQVVDLAIMDANAGPRVDIGVPRSFDIRAQRRRIVPDFKEGREALGNPARVSDLVAAFSSSPERPMPTRIVPLDAVTDPRAPGVVIPRDMTPWPGGARGPKDRDGEYVLMADGRYGLVGGSDKAWGVTGDTESSRGPIIAYRQRRPMTEEEGRSEDRRRALVTGIVVGAMLSR
jgi:hypothetical protein